MNQLMSSPSVESNLASVEPNELVCRSLSGCTDSTNELVNRFMPRLVRFLEKRLDGRHTDAEDIAQESMTRALQKLDRFDGKHRFSTWLYTIAYRLSVDFIRRERRRPRAVSIELVDNQMQQREKASEHDAAESIWKNARRILVKSQYVLHELPTEL
jgi:RNA polymerase sigma factor (sigma-70 family)